MRVYIQCILLCITLFGPTLTAQNRHIHHDEHRGDKRYPRTQLFGSIYSNDKSNTVTIGTISVRDYRKQVMIDTDGNYEIYLPEGKHTLIIESLGYEPQEVTVDIKGDKPIRRNFTLKEKIYELGEFEVTAKSAIQNVRESAYNVVAIDVKPLHNTTLDIASVLNRVSGVKVRSDGGVGADVSFSLNGFGGRHIKFFMNGVPMDGFGKEFKLSNIPVGMIDRIEVYKGVVPIEFGSDALGGVINLVTSNKKRTHLEASFSAGSFNTYKSDINFTKIFQNGLSVQLYAFHNFSDNSYKVYLDPDNSGTERWVKRFNDRFNNGTGTVKVGFVNKPFADQLYIGFTYGKGRKGIQHGTTMDKVFGRRHEHSETIMPSLEYAKSNLFTEGLNVKLTGNYNLGYTQYIDTTSYVYNWLGEATKSGSKGESGSGPSMMKYYNNNGSTTFNISYMLGRNHEFNINNVLTLFNRKTKDPLAVKETEAEKSAEEKRRSLKNITGLSYKYTLNKYFNASAFGKYYWAKHTLKQDVETTNTFGYGLVATTFFQDFQLKASYELTHRLPTANELFGDGALEWANFELKPEKGNNFNIGLSTSKVIARKHALYFDVGYMYRLISDYIIRNIYGEGTRASMSNHGKVLSSGINAEARYIYNNLLSVGGNVTYQSVKNNERYKAGTDDVESTLYKLRMPNVPYLFANADAGFTFRNLGYKGNDFYIGYNMNYVHQFYYDWSIYGVKESKSVIPSQVSHDINISYNLLKKSINLSAECRNIGNAKLYDNYYIQKPGRSFMFKIRYIYH
ncbi:TonB-dependent receptor [Dysgonomonas sp. Marseille-P4677]|uniref:TonB-dependent receptor n=1 Tax=Dysgonomonas sp. Marseille-P4677 TaxID=2364790 RepID=UPI0019145977|nr:TonB-dependent receptor plug domain-containing protein [Dysgonomonas sp. Marseille-P4677]MBK5722191.1 TonB-dependent receptor [Dysgonomonas sp. Marseille-P4677]